MTETAFVPAAGVIFRTPFDQYSEHNGKIVVSILGHVVEEAGTEDEVTLYHVLLEDGVTLQAFENEIKIPAPIGETAVDEYELPYLVIHRRISDDGNVFAAYDAWAEKWGVGGPADKVKKQTMWHFANDFFAVGATQEELATSWDAYLETLTENGYSTASHHADFRKELTVLGTTRGVAAFWRRK